MRLLSFFASPVRALKEWLYYQSEIPSLKSPRQAVFKNKPKLTLNELPAAVPVLDANGNMKISAHTRRLSAVELVSLNRKKYTAKVVRFVDGQRIVVRKGKRQFECRLELSK